MDQKKIGIFIAKCRKEKNYTQERLANKLGITSKAVSKWERGLCLPDASIMLELCNMLDISVNELLTGEIIEDENKLQQAEENLVKLSKEQQASNKAFRFTFCFGMTIMLILNIFNVINYGIDVAMSKPEYIFMDILTFIWYTLYIIFSFAAKSSKPL